MTSLQKLRLWLNQGKSVSAKDFPRGFRLSARCYDLRKSGWIITTTIKDNGLAYYKLVKTKKK